MTEIYTGSRQAWQKIADVIRRRGGKNDPLPANPGMIGQGGPSWYWGEILADVDSGSWTEPTRGYAKIMVPDPDSDDDPRVFVPWGEGTVTGIAGSVVTSPGHGLSVGKPIWFTGNKFFQVGSVPSVDTFVIVGSGGSPVVSATWCIALPFTNRDPTLEPATGSVCKLEYAFKEWSLKWIGC